jgi:hypothetical protein
VSKPAKKERRRLKQKQKHKQAIKLRNESPYKRLGKSGRIESCKVNDTCREQGLFSIYAMISVPNRPPTLVCFLVDKWCMGLKDAWGRLDMTHEEYHDFIESANHRAGFTLVDMDPDEARMLIAAGIRQAHELGFRLPANYDKWTKAMGIGDWASADISDFGKDGKYRFIGPLNHLASHLIDGDIEKFFDRPDVNYIAGLPDDFEPDGEVFEDFEDEQPDDLDLDDDDELTEEDMREIEEAMDTTSNGMQNAVRKWCFANGLAPHPCLDEAVMLMIIATAKRDASAADAAERILPSREEILSMVDWRDRGEVGDALDQLWRAMGSYESADAFADAAGLVVPDDEEDDEGGR